MSRVARTVRVLTPSSATIVAAIATAPSARARRHRNGSPSAKPSCCPLATSMLSTRYPVNCEMSLIRTSASSMTAHESGGRDHARHRGRSKTPRCQDRHHRRAAHVGFGADASSTCAYDRARRRSRSGGGGATEGAARSRLQQMDLVALQLPRPRQRARAFVPRQIPHHDYGRARRRPIEVLQHPRWARRQTNLQALPGAAAPDQVVVYCKEPFAGPKQVLRYLSRYTHRVAISNRRLVAADDGGVSFRWKDYRIEGPGCWKTMTLAPHEFIRRFLMHVLPKGFHRIRHYGLLASGTRAANIARARELLAVPNRSEQSETPEAAALHEPRRLPRPCTCCGGRMFIIETFARGCQPKHRPTPAAIGIDTS